MLTNDALLSDGTGDTGMSESTFTRRVCDELESIGCEVYPIVAQTMGKNGWPDRLVIGGLGVWLLEFKSSRGELRKRQELVIARINRVRSGTAYVVREAATTTRGVNVVEDEQGQYLGSFRNGIELLAVLVSLSR